ncbi:hypothetical protein Bca4012_084360 [Brassica carinata]
MSKKVIEVGGFRAVSHLIRRLCYVTAVKLLLYKGASAPVLVSVVATLCEMICFFWVLRRQSFAAVNVHLLNTFKRFLNPGSVYSVSGFDVTRSIINFKLLASPIFVRFSESTPFKEITAPVRPIPYNFSGSAIMMNCSV